MIFAGSGRERLTGEMIVKVPGTKDCSCTVYLTPSLTTSLASFCPPQSCPMLPKFGKSPKFRGFQEIAQNIAQKFCAIFRFMLKTPNTPPNE